MAVKWKFRDGKWRRINVEFEEQKSRTLLLSSTIRAIYDKDATLNPAEQQEMVFALPGLTISEMKAIVKAHHSTGMDLAATVREIISKHRATD